MTNIANTPPFQPGFRLSVLDALVLASGAAGSVLVAQIDLPLGLAIAFTVGHFFLFCNVFRMPRPLELTWATLFVLLAGSTLLNQIPTWYQTFILCFAVTCTLVPIQMCRPSYHGVLWKYFNPGLPDWWTRNGGRRK